MRLHKIALLFGLTLGGSYLAHGFFVLLASPTGASDLFRRSFEARQILRGESPYDMYAGHFPPIAREVASETGHPVPPLPEGAEFEAANVPAYPPWAFPLIILTAGVPWPYGRWYFAALNALSLLLIALCLRGLMKSYGVAERPALIAGMLVSSIGWTLGLGQYGVLVLGLMAGAMLLDDRDHWLPAGVCLAASMLKFNITLPFILLFVLKRRWRTLGSALATGAALFGIGCWSIHTGPVAAMHELRILLSHNLAGGDSLPQALAQAIGYSDRLVTIATALVLLAGGAALYVLRRQNELVLCAITAVIARVSIYHRHYDDLVLVYLLLALWALSPRGRLAQVGFWLVGLSLWIPPSIGDWLIETLGSERGPIAFQYFAWAFGAAAVSWVALTSGGKRDVPA